MNPPVLVHPPVGEGTVWISRITHAALGDLRFILPLSAGASYARTRQRKAPVRLRGVRQPPLSPLRSIAHWLGALWGEAEARRDARRWQDIRT